MTLYYVYGWWVYSQGEGPASKGGGQVPPPPYKWNLGMFPKEL